MINRYFESSIYLLIDEMKTLMLEKNSELRKEYANTKFSEADFAVRLGFPFGRLARYPMQGTQGQDIIIDSKDFEIEVKYWRNWLDGSRKVPWLNSYGKAFNWLIGEIENGKKNNRAIICGWFTFFEWSELLQLGETRGPNPIVSQSRLDVLPFLSRKGERIRSVQTKYIPSHGEISIKTSSYKVNWELYGNESDVLNVLMLW